MSSHDRILAALRSLQLPIDPTLEHDSHEALIEYAESWGLASSDDLAILLEHEVTMWDTTGRVGPHLKRVVGLILTRAPEVLARLDGPAYFTTFAKLVDGTKDRASLSNTEARRLLSRSALIAQLLSTERFSCSQVSRLLRGIDSSLDVPYGAVSAISRGLKIRPALNVQAAGGALWDADKEHASTLFPDSTWNETMEIAARELSTWLPENVFLVHLTRVSSGTSTGEPFWPYLQILHWCLTPLEFFDHPASYLYEFSPRGALALELFGRYPAVTGNPVLNNAKAVAALDVSWARNRGGGDAHALVGIVKEIESLPFVSRRQAARVLRAWLIRILELRQSNPIPLDDPTHHNDFLSIATFTCENETNTRGVIEQRVVDCLATLAFARDNWRPRGLGDGVNASNLSRKKLGDIEFTNVDSRTAIALEAHGGYLSSTYVLDHQRSLARIIEQRLIDSWSLLDEPANWHIRILFVAHTRETENLPTHNKLHEVAVTYEYLDYGALFALATEETSMQDQLDAFKRYVVAALNRPTVRESARQRYREILAK